MKRHSLILIISLVWILIPGAHAQERRQVPEYQHIGGASADELASFVARYEKSWRELDARLFADLHSADTEWINAFARLFRGREALHRFISEKLFPEFDRIFDDMAGFKLNLISSRRLSQHHAVLHLYTDIQSPTGDAASRRTHFHLVLSKSNQQWQIVHTAIMDAR